MESVYYPDYSKFFQKPSDAPKDRVEFIWLGQAGFAFRYNDTTLIIDPYLSDYLSKKYKDGIFPHIRLMDMPILPENIKNLDILLSTHSHSDHMDPETIPKLTQANPNASIIIPGPTRDEAIKRGAPSKNIISAYSELPILIDEDLEIIPIPAAHEELQTDENGDHLFLGYIFKFGKIIAYHSGDCVPYDGLADLLKNNKVQIAFLPINGRDEYRRTNNIAGNFRISEVIEICKTTQIPKLVAHHFGMFAYNTVTDSELHSICDASSKELEIYIPQIHKLYVISENEK